MEIISFDNGIFGATTYLIYDKKTLEGALIDCTCAVDEISKKIKDEKINLKYILITHGHFDHVYCLSKMKERFPEASILIHKNDLELIRNMDTQCQMAEVESIKVPCADGLIDEDTKNLKLGEYDIKIIHTKGHTKGGVCYLIDGVLFSGDTLFQDSIGRCDLWGGSLSEIEESITQKLYKLDDNTVVYPGHGASTTIGYEKRHNQYFRI